MSSQVLKRILTFIFPCILVMDSVTALADSGLTKYTGDGETFDFVIEHKDGVATLYLAEKPTNMPFVDAKPGYRSDEEATPSLHFKATEAPGVYRLELDGQLPEGQIVVQTAAINEAVDAYVEDSHGHSDHDEAGQGTSNNFWNLLILGLSCTILGVLMGRLSRFWQRRKDSKDSMEMISKTAELAAEEQDGAYSHSSIDKIGVIFFAACLGSFSQSPKVYAGPGHSHAEVSIGGEADGATIKISKKSQFLINLHTQEVHKEKHTKYLSTFGHIIAKPNLDSVIKAPKSGFLKGDFSGLWGSKVVKGQRLGRIESVGSIVLTSPITGIVMETSAVDGMRTEAGDRLFRIVDTSKLWIDAEVFQRDLMRLGNAKTAFVSLEGKNERIEAKVLSARSFIDENSLAAKVFLEIENSESQIPLGAAVHVSFNIDSGDVEGVLLPRRAIVNRGGESLVYVQTGPETFEPRSVTTLYSASSDQVVISGEIDDGDRIVIQGNYQLLVGAH